MARPPVFSRPSILAVLAAPVIMAGCAQTSTYGTGEMPEMALFREMTGGLTSKKEKQPIDYQPRAPLVLPPTAAQLPPPVDAASAANPNWPVDPNEQVLASAAETDDNPRNGQAEYRRLRPFSGIFAAARSNDVTPPSNDEQMNAMDAYMRDIVHGKKTREEFARRLADAKGYGRSERRYLTDPPLAYREPAATAPTEFEDVKKKKGFFLTRWLTGG